MVTRQYQAILADNGYNAEDYAVEVILYSEANQVLIVRELVSGRQACMPYEDNILGWKPDRLAQAVVDLLDEANNNVFDVDF